jgi:hypothetical protein
MEYFSEVCQWDVFEVALDGPTMGNPFVDVELNATFTHDKKTIRSFGFYDGDGVYRIRCLADRTGKWAFRTQSNVSALDDKSGTFFVRAARAGQRGPVRVTDRFHFAYENGERYFPFGTTCYVWTHQAEALQQKTLETLRFSPFNKLRMCVFPKHYDYNTNQPARFPFEGNIEIGWNWRKPNPEYFRHLEGRIRDLDELGVEADLILFHPYDQWGFSAMDSATDDFYLSYLTARLSSFPNIWWSLANEYDLMKAKTIDDWERFARIIQQRDAWRHLRSIHNCLGFYDHSREWVTHCSLQRVDVYKTSENTNEWRDRWQKPIVIDECGYEGNINWGWGNLTGQEMTRRMWEGVVRGGYVGHGETYLNEREELWWSKGGELVGSSVERIRFLRTLLESASIKNFSPIPMGLWYWDVPVGGELGKYYLFFFGASQPRFRVIDLPEDGEFSIDVIDAWEMSITRLDGAHKGKVRVDLPGKPMMAIRAIRSS